jgi:Tol biopolymer transport system component
MNSDGSKQKQLTNHPAADTDPYWTEDGKRIIFTTERNGSKEIFVMNADGSDQKILENPALYERRHNLSPDGKRMVAELNINDQIKILEDIKSKDLTPDIKKKLTGRNRNDEIFVMNIDGSNKIKLTNTHGSVDFPCWSPDGKKIAFVRTLVGEWGPAGNVQSQLYVVNPDQFGSQKWLTDTGYLVCMTSRPSWSPDSRKIAFESKKLTTNNVYTSDDIYTIDVEGSGLKRLTENPARDYAPCWSPFLSYK